MTLEGLRCSTFVGKISNDFAIEVDIFSNPRILNSASCIDFALIVQRTLLLFSKEQLQWSNGSSDTLLNRYQQLRGHNWMLLTHRP